MIPVHLTFSGLYSYQKKQSVDFEKLMAAQLFGIFGSVGSGKSTILEAIMFVLFDRSDRLNKSGDNRYYNMLNLQSNALEIDFTFRANAKSNTKYRAYFSAQRKKRDFEKVEVKERGFYEWKSEQWIPLPNSDASEVLGMTYENFMQTVIIPQGKFREFIDQRPNVRTQMLKDLFQLHRFDLGAKTGLLLRKTETVITDLQARLMEIGQISEEDITGQQELLKTAEGELSHQQQLANQLDQQCQQLDALRKLLENIDATESELKQLTDQSEYFDSKEKQLKAYTKAETFFNEKFRLLEETTVEAQLAQQELQKLKDRIDLGGEKVQRVRQEVTQKKAAYERREQIDRQYQDLLHLIEIKKAQPRRQQLSDKLTQIRRQQEVVESSISKQQAQLEQHEERLLAAESRRNQWLVLKEVANWAQRREEFVEEQQGINRQIQQYERNITALTAKQESVLIAYNWPESSQLDELTDKFVQFEAKLHQQQDAINKELSDLRLQERLVQAASQLTSGKPCLLCGSTEHPQIIHSQSVKKALDTKQEELTELRRKEASFRELQRDIQKLSSQNETARQMIEQEQKRTKELAEKQNKHEKLHKWPEFKRLTIKEINHKLKVSQQEQQEVQQWQQMRQQGQKKLKELQLELENLRSQQQSLLQQQSSLQAAEEQRQAMLQVYLVDDFLNVTLDKMQEMSAQKRVQLADVEQQYEQAQQTLQEYQNAVIALEGRYEASLENQQKLSQKAEALNEEIQALCTEKEFDNVSEIKLLINLELDIDAEQQAILTYRNRRHNAEVTLHKWQAELAGTGL